MKPFYSYPQEWRTPVVLLPCDYVHFNRPYIVHESFTSMKGKSKRISVSYCLHTKIECRDTLLLLVNLHLLSQGVHSGARVCTGPSPLKPRSSKREEDTDSRRLRFMSPESKVPRLR